ncbi:EI24 domain-containing protein [Aquimarina sp. U1-2]|uniref:EI24 domain-containing protein n=1 Tax=Aquimarina sp. U1-2 TaxID=2823141 RepID=UPI001AECF0AA|nr:EI24 domain-containing protein [Aquimarina sp. U1-2]MBP2834158.1 EI24 domain-containing protein [Aquimarina sp. U1-2]
MLAAIYNAIKAYLGTFSLISKLKLWKYFAIPILISVVAGCTFMALAYTFSDTIGQIVAKLWVWEWGSETFATISTFFGGLVIFVLGLILYKHIVMALSAPFMSPVSEKIEKYLLGVVDTRSKSSFVKQLLRGIRINSRNLIKELLYMIPLLILSFIPVIGILGTFLIFLVQAYYVGFGNMDYTMERYFNYKESVQFVKKHRGTAIGNGMVFVLMLFIPVIGFIITLPIAVVAASTETVNVLRKEQVITTPNSIVQTESQKLH